MSINNYSLIKTNYHILNVDSKEFLFHIPTSSVFELSPESSKLLKQIENNEEIFKYDEEIVEEFKELNILGGKTNEKLVPVSEETEIVSIQGFVSKPEFAKKSRGEQFFFVNDRFIKSGYLHHAVMAAFDGILKDGLQPSYFLYLTVEPNTIDINIHPTKTEIKFDDEHALYAILRASIKHSLGQFNVAPVLDFDRDANLDTPYHYKDLEGSFPTIEVNGNFNPFAETAPTPQKSYSSYKNRDRT